MTMSFLQSQNTIPGAASTTMPVASTWSSLAMNFIGQSFHRLLSSVPQLNIYARKQRRHLKQLDGCQYIYFYLTSNQPLRTEKQSGQLHLYNCCVVVGTSSVGSHWYRSVWISLWMANFSCVQEFWGKTRRRLQVRRQRSQHFFRLESSDFKRKWHSGMLSPMFHFCLKTCRAERFI